MQVLIKNKVFSLRGNSTITDLQGNPVANVQGRVFSITNKKYINDMQGNTRYLVRNKFFHFFMKSAFIYDADGNLVCQVKRKLALHSKFEFLRIDKNWELSGNIIGWNFSLLENGAAIAQISRQFHWNDAFLLDTGNQDPFLMMAIVIAIDNITDREANS